MKLAKQTRTRLWMGFVVGLVVLAILAIAAYAYWLSAPSAATHAAANEPLQCPDTSVPSPHPGMVWVPPGAFVLGDTVYKEELPLTRTTVGGFWMDRTEVTNAQFAQFVQATGYVTVAERPVDPLTHPGLPPELQQPGAVVFINPTELAQGGDIRQWWQYVAGANWRHPGGPKTSIAAHDAFPVVNVTIEDANAYAKWAGHTLPTEAQWEWAALGGKTPANGDISQPAEANTWQGLFPVSNKATDGFAGLAPTGCFAANGYGLKDMIGNAWELTADRYTESHSAQDNIPPDQPPLAQRPGTPLGRHVIKGGSFLCAPNYCQRYRAGARQPQEDDLATSHLGFRTLLHSPGP
jgi:formylglycine-generating enzyme